MKILMLTSGTVSSTLTHRVVAIGRELVQLGHEVTMIAPSSDRHSKWELDNPAQVDGIQMVYPYQFRSKSFLINLIPYVIGAGFEVLRRKADVVYVYKPTPATIVGLLAKWFKHTPIVLDMDDLGSEVMKLEGNPAFVYGLVEACEQLAARQATAILAASRLLNNEYSNRFPDKQIMRLSNGVDVRDFIPVEAGRSRTPRIVFFAMLGRASIMTPLIKALPSVIEQVGSDKVQVEMLGDGPARGQLESLARSTGVAKNIHFRGWTTFVELSNYVADGDIAICITPDERTTAACSNQKVFQYMAMRLSPIVSNVGDLPLYVEDGKSGIVVPAGDIEALSDAIVRLLKNTAERKSFGRRGRKLAETVYSWKTLGGQVEEMLAGLI